jgi:hypothetical protein
MNEAWQQRLDAAFTKYFAMSKVLGADINALLDTVDDSESARRNFVRAATALAEGYAHCFREMCAVGLETGAGPLTSKEVQVLKEEHGFSAADRIKYTLRGTYKLFQLPDSPQFSESGWQDAQFMIEKRDALMHPKSVDDLALNNKVWDQSHRGAVWLFDQLFGFMSKLAKVHGT